MIPNLLNSFTYSKSYNGPKNNAINKKFTLIMFIEKVDIPNYADDNTLYKSSPNLLNSYKSMIF